MNELRSTTESNFSHLTAILEDGSSSQERILTIAKELFPHLGSPSLLISHGHSFVVISSTSPLFSEDLIDVSGLEIPFEHLSYLSKVGYFGEDPALISELSFEQILPLYKSACTCLADPLVRICTGRLLNLMPSLGVGQLLELGHVLEGHLNKDLVLQTKINLFKRLARGDLREEMVEETFFPSFLQVIRHVSLIYIHEFNDEEKRLFNHNITISIAPSSWSTFMENLSLQFLDYLRFPDEIRKTLVLNLPQSLNFLPKLNAPYEAVAKLTPSHLAFYLNNYGKFCSLSRSREDHLRFLQMEASGFSFLFTPRYEFKSPSSKPNSPNPFITRMLYSETLHLSDLFSGTGESLQALINRSP